MEKEMTLSNSEGKEYTFKLRLDEDSIHFYLKEKNVYVLFLMRILLLSMIFVKSIRLSKPVMI